MKNLALHLTLLVVLLAVSGCSRQSNPIRLQSYADIEAEAKAYPVQVANARRMGLPLSLRELDSPPAPTANAAPIYQKLGHMLRAYPLNSKELALEGLSTPPMPTDRALGFARQALAHRVKYLQMIHQAAMMPACSFSHDWSAKDPESIMFPEIDTFRESSLLLTGQSVLMATDGQTLQAVQNEALNFRLADQILGDRILWAYKVACAIDTTTFNTMQKILYMSHGDPKVAQAVEAAVAQGWHPRSLATSLESEVAFQQGMVSYVRSEGPQPFSDTLAPTMELYGLKDERAGSPAWNRLMDANAAVLLREMSEAILATGEPFPAAHRRMKGIVADSMKQTPSHILSKALVPDLASFATLQASDHARAEITQTAAAVLSWQAAHAALPDSLSTIMPVVPEDPFSGKSLRYKKEDAGFIIYSVGPFGTFDGGSPNSEPPVSESLFRYPLPPYDFPAKPAPAPQA
jgi:hypothetical protein